MPGTQERNPDEYVSPSRLPDDDERRGLWAAGSQMETGKARKLPQIMKRKPDSQVEVCNVAFTKRGKQC